ncbi:class A beta-lactamase-related serine hydrolase [Egibacter rhizosphaerae]|uniref:Class A beta-lactamase-related serine hydrolase n=1 Tax=Egibacter rhizosphaerae TaxID=1670831 RepID=A0A411YEG3_9ACTN|nr:serine hydrolase domain-containing protein [Egibacter rhizosphaerae]QBI19586.1 class A beta-lactamase-related serine hydrolase [Egibacter rhizosphaerae]
MARLDRFVRTSRLGKAWLGLLVAGAVLAAVAPAVRAAREADPVNRVRTDAAEPAAAETLDAHLEDLEGYLAEEVAVSPLPGLAVAVTHGDEIVHLAGYGSAAHGEPMTPDTPMRLASLSKSFTALAVLRLAEEGALDLDDPVRDHVPGVVPADHHAGTPLTLRHLLNQTGGLADRSFDRLWDLDVETPADRVTQLAGAEPVAQPGTAHRYSNPNYEILARVVEVASGETFDDYLDEAVFGPLGMDDTAGHARTDLATPEVAQGHVVAFGVPVARDEPPGFIAGSGGVVSTASDSPER